MRTLTVEPPHCRHLGLLSRRILVVLLVAATWIPTAHHLGNRGEAFWLLFPLIDSFLDHWPKFQSPFPG